MSGPVVNLGQFYVGEDFQIRATFKDASGNLTSDVVLTLDVEAPGSAVARYAYPGNIQQASVGVFFVPYNFKKPGSYTFTWTNTVPGFNRKVIGQATVF